MTAPLFEHGHYYIIAVPTGYEVYRNGATAATRVGRYGHGYFERAKADVLADRWSK